MKNIRKIIIGNTITKDAMSYTVGQQVIRGQYEIDSIVKDDNGLVTIWIAKDEEVLPWKEISSNVPVTIEFSQDFS